MGIFKKDISGESVLVQTFQTIAQAIDVAAQLGIDKETGIEIGDVWALYFWTIKPFENNADQLNPHLYSLLKHSPGSPSLEAQANKTQTHKNPTKVIFPIHPDDYELYLKVAMEIKEFLESNYLQIKEVDNGHWMQQCGNQIEEIIKKNLPSLYTKSTQTVIFILTLALRSILKDVNEINSATISRLRKSGFFHISIMATSWQFKTEGQL